LDPLTETVRLLRPKALTWKQAEHAGEWTLRFRGHAGMAFCLIAAGNCRLEMAGHQPRRLDQGDYLLLAAPPAWTLGNGEAVAGVDFEAPPTSPDPHRTSQPSWANRGDARTVTRLIGGHFGFDEANADLLAALVPAVAHIRSSEPGAARLRSMLGLVDEEASSDRPGRTVVLERLLEIMLVEAIRHTSDNGGEVRQGLLAGLADRQVAAALRALHDDIRRQWTVAQLADVAGSSRSVFAERFNRIVGMPPIDYLTQWRMALAKDALCAGAGRLNEVAFACGYQSASAFSTAFSRVVGCSPARYAAGRRAQPVPDTTTDVSADEASNQAAAKQPA
jgi:AraC-like DNA-binding protein